MRYVEFECSDCGTIIEIERPLSACFHCKSKNIMPRQTDINRLHDIVIDLATRMADLEHAMVRLSEIMQGIEDNAVQLEASTKTLTANLQELERRFAVYVATAEESDDPLN